MSEKVYIGGTNIRVDHIERRIKAALRKKRKAKVKGKKGKLK